MTFDPFGPAPGKPVQPKPDAPNPPPAPSGGGYISWVLIAALAGWIVYEKAPRPQPAPQARIAGRQWARGMAESYAEALDVYLASLDRDTPEQDAQQAFQARWTELRTARHRVTVQPVLGQIRPPGTEWTDPNQKQRYKDAVKAIQQGLRDVR
jgi:hypothetical protein